MAAKDYILVDKADLQAMMKEASRPTKEMRGSGGGRVRDVRDRAREREEKQSRDAMDRLTQAMKKAGRGDTKDIRDFISKHMSGMRREIVDLMKGVKKIASGAAERAESPGRVYRGSDRSAHRGARAEGQDNARARRARAREVEASENVITQMEMLVGGRGLSRVHRELEHVIGAISSLATSTARIAQKIEDNAGLSSNTSAKVSGVTYASRGGRQTFKPRGSDTVPAMLTPGEFVVRSEMARKYGSLLEAINDGHLDSTVYRAHGGPVQYLSGGGSTDTIPMGGATLGDFRKSMELAISQGIQKSGILMGGSSRPDGSHASALEDIGTVNAYQDIQRSLENNKGVLGKLTTTLTKMQGIIGLFAGLKLVDIIRDVAMISKETQNLTGGMLGSVEASMAYKDSVHESTVAMRNLGFTNQEIQEGTIAMAKVEVAGAKRASRYRKQTLMASRALGVGAGDAAEHFGEISKFLSISGNPIEKLAAGTLRVAQNTGVAASKVFDIQKGMAEQVKSAKKLGPLTTNLLDTMTDQQAIAKKFGKDDQLNSVMDALTNGAPELTQKLGEMGIAGAYAIQNLQKLHDPSKVLSGAFMRTKQGRRDAAASMADSFKTIADSANGIDDLGRRMNYIRMATNGMAGSMEDLRDGIQMFGSASMTASQKAKKLESVLQQVEDMRKSGASEQSIESMLPSIAGDPGIKSIEELKRHYEANQKNALNPIDELKDEMFQHVKVNMGQLMNSGVDFNKALEKALADTHTEFGSQLNGQRYSFSDLQEVGDRAQSPGANIDANKVDEAARAATANPIDSANQAAQKAEIKLVEMADAVSNAVGAINPFNIGLNEAASYLGFFSTALVTAIAAMTGVAALGSAKRTFGGMLGGMLGRGRGGSGSDFPSFDRSDGSSTGGLESSRSKSGGVGRDTGGGRGRGRGGMSLGGPGLGGGSFLMELAKIAAAIMLIGGTMYVMSKVMPKAEEIWEVSKSLGLSVMAFAGMYVAMQGLEALGKKYGMISWRTVGQVAMVMGAMTIIGASLGLVIAATALSWSLVDRSDIEELNDKVTTALPILFGLLGATVLFAGIGAFASKLPKNVLVGAGLGIVGILLAMAGVGWGLGKVMKATTKGWSTVSMGDLNSLNEKMEAATGPLIAIAATTAILGAIGAAFGVASMAGGAGLFAAGGAIAGILVGMGALAFVGWAMGKVVQASIAGWSSVKVEDIRELNQKMSLTVEGLASVGNTLYKFMGGDESTWLGAADKIVTTAAALVDVGMSGAGLGVAMSATIKGWSGINVSEVQGVAGKIESSKAVLDRIGVATTGLADPGWWSSLSDSINTLLGGGKLDSIGKLGDIGSALGMAVVRIANSFNGADDLAKAATQVENANKMVLRMTMALENAKMGIAKISEGGDINETEIAKYVGRFTSLISEMQKPITVLDGITNLDQRINQVYAMADAMAALYDAVKSLASLDGEKSMEGTLSTINDAFNSPGAGGVMSSTPLEGRPVDILESSSKKGPSEVNLADDDMQVLRDILAQAKQQVGELQAIKQALAYRPRPDPQQPRLSGNSRGIPANVKPLNTGKIPQGNDNLWSGIPGQPDQVLS